MQLLFGELAFFYVFSFIPTDFHWRNDLIIYLNRSHYMVDFSLTVWWLDSYSLIRTPQPPFKRFTWPAVSVFHANHVWFVFCFFIHMCNVMLKYWCVETVSKKQSISNKFCSYITWCLIVDPDFEASRYDGMTNPKYYF